MHKNKHYKPLRSTSFKYAQEGFVNWDRYLLVFLDAGCYILKEMSRIQTCFGLEWFTKVYNPGNSNTGISAFFNSVIGKK